VQPVRGSPILDRYKDIDQKPLASIDRSKQLFVGQPPAPFQDHPLEEGKKTVFFLSFFILSFLFLTLLPPPTAGEPMVPDEMEDLYIAVAAELKVNHTDIIIGLLVKVHS
jgi:hypothetical protein